MLKGIADVIKEDLGISYHYYVDIHLSMYGT